MPLKDHLNKLEYYCAIVENKSILKASYQMNITQPQLSRVVKQLEEDLGKLLLVRNAKGIEPTKEGIELYNLSLKLLQDVRATEKQIKHGTADLKGTVRIGTYDSIARYFFPSFLKFLKSTSPNLDILLETARSRQVFERVKKGQLELGVCVDHISMKSRAVIKETIYEDSFGFYQHPNISTDFSEQLILFPDSIGIKFREEEIFTKIYKFRSQIVLDNLETVKSLAEEGVGVAFLPHRVAREALLQGKLIARKSNANQLNLYPHSVVLCRYKSSLPEGINTVVDELIRFLSSWAKN